MQIYNTLNEMMTNKLAVVIRGNNQITAQKTAIACAKGGIKTLEITFTIPGALDLIKSLKDYDNLVIGAGTVLDSETARVAILAGAEFIVSPSFDEATAKLCNRYGALYFPGCMTVNEMIRAAEFGVSIIKLFPSIAFNPSIIEDLKGPLPHINIMPTGGVSFENANRWLESGAVMLGIGGEITRPGKNKDYEKVTQLAKEFLKLIRKDVNVVSKKKS